MLGIFVALSVILHELNIGWIAFVLVVSENYSEISAIFFITNDVYPSFTFTKLK